LGEIAVNPVWSVTTRQQAVDLLGHLFKVDQDWGRDESVKAWMLTIITKLGSITDQAVNTIALALLQEINQHKSALIQHPYPLTTRVPIPASSPILAKVLNIPSVEYDIHKLRVQRLKEIHLQVYIPPMAKVNLQARDDDHFPLMDRVQKFLASDRQVMLILGDSGSGKSTFNKHLELELLQSYTRGGSIPLFINLPVIDEPQQDMIEKQLKTYNFNDDQINELKKHRQLVLICDGYDESQQLVNLHNTNSLNQPGQWNTKMIISCRSQYLDKDYRSRFMPQGGSNYAYPALELFQEAAIIPFSKVQIIEYIKQYVLLEPRTWNTQGYLDKLAIIPNLMDLVKNPFVLTLALEALPLVVEGKQELSAIRITRVQLYDIFVVHWLNVNKQRLEEMTLSVEERGILDQLLDAGFISMGTEYSTNLASAIFDQQGGNPIVQYIHLKHKATWKAKFFGPEPEIRLLRESSPLTRTGSLFQFLHRSMQEYFYSRTVYDPSPHVNNDMLSLHPDHDYELDPHGPLFMRNLLTEPYVIQFLYERVKQHPNFEKQLLAVIEQSKTDPTAATAAANAITILVRAGVRFNGADLRGIRIPGADLSGSQLDSAQLQDADLTNVTFVGSWLRQANLSGARMNGVRFGELPFLKEETEIIFSVYSPNGRMLVVGATGNILSIYDTTTWNKAYRHVHHPKPWCVAFSPINQQLVYGDIDGTVSLWNFATDNTTLTMKGHAGIIRSVAFSPYGKQLASAGDDKTVRLWNSGTGECVFILQGHTKMVLGVAYSSDGQRLVSGSEDGTIRVWDPETRESVACWSIAHEEYSELAFSADGQWVAVTLGGKIQITNTVTGELGPILNTEGDSYAAFSSNGQWIVTLRELRTLRLWDRLSGHLISSFSGHTDWILSCDISPSGSQIVSGDFRGHVRLWEVDTSRAIVDIDRPTETSRGIVDFERPTHSVVAVTYSPDGRSILSGRLDQEVQQWESLTGECMPIRLKMDDDIWSFSLSPDGIQIAIGHDDGTIGLYNRQAGPAVCTLLGHTSRVTQLVYSPCGRWIVSSSAKEARLWDLHTNEDPGVIAQTESFEKICIALTPAGQIVLGSPNYTISLHDPRAQDPCTSLKEIAMHCGICSLDCSPDGQELAIGATDCTVYLWDFQSKKPGIELKGHGRWVDSVVYSPCGKWILSGGRDKTVRIWRFRSGEIGSWSCVAVVDALSDYISSLAWCPVAPTLEFVTGCYDGSVRVWRIASHDDGDGGNVSVHMLWGNDIRILCTSDLTFKGAIGLSPINHKLLVQRTGRDILDVFRREEDKSGAEDAEE
ncbi:hypothetical protein BGW39_001594, partial [Mortierella sp. 14UC]